MMLFRMSSLQMVFNLLRREILINMKFGKSQLHVVIRFSSQEPYGLQLALGRVLRVLRRFSASLVFAPDARMMTSC